MPLRLIALICVLLASPLARAQMYPGAGGLAYGPRGQSHAWVAMPVTGPAILHLAPRAAAVDSDRDAVKPAAAGSTRLAAPLAELPMAMAAWENQVFLLFPPTAAEVGSPSNPPRFPVLGLTASPGPMGSVWAFDNLGGRLRVLPSLWLDGALLSFVGTSRGPAALVRQGDHIRILLLDIFSASEPREAWRDLPLPEGVAEDPAGLHLISTARGLGLARLSPASTASEPALANGLWTGVLRGPQAEDADPSDVPIHWTFRPLSMRLIQGPEGRAPAPQGPVFRIHGGGPGAIGDGVLIYTTRQLDSDGQPSLRVWNPTGAGTILLATVPDVSDNYAIAPLDDVGRLAVLWSTQPPSAPAASDRRAAITTEVRLAEIAIADGAIVYSGPAIGKGPVSSEELRLLAVAMVAVMALILVFVLRPEEGRTPVNLPKGVALAEPGRRIIASLIDFVLAALITGALTGRSAIDLVLLVGVFTDAGGMLGLLLMLGIGFLVSTLSEWLFARSAGKALTGSAVAVPRIVDMPDPESPATKERVPTLARPTLWRAAVRNLVKWFLPPVAMMGLSAPDHRHRGDLSAGTIVVIPVTPPE
jgi:hypothetical protein